MWMNNVSNLSKKRDVLSEGHAAVSADSVIFVLTVTVSGGFWFVYRKWAVVHHCPWFLSSRISYLPSLPAAVFRPGLMFYSGLAYYIFWASTTAGEMAGKGKFSRPVNKCWVKVYISNIMKGKMSLDIFPLKIKILYINVTCWKLCNITQQNNTLGFL